jgi:hypothetical protein
MVTLAPFEIRHCPSVAANWSRPGCLTVNSSQMSTRLPPEDAANVTIAEPLRTQKANAVPASFAGIRDTSYARSVFLNSLPYQPGPVPSTQVLTTIMSVRCGLGRKPLVRRFNSDRGLHLIKFLNKV